MPAAVGIGISGWSDDPSVTRDLVALTIDRCRASRHVMAGDALTSFVGASGGRAGVVVAAGTGAVAVAADAQGRWARSDGLGHLVGDWGSGYWIGREGLARAIRDNDRGRTTGLRTKAEARFGRLPLLVDGLLRDVHPVTQIAAFTSDVAALANAGDRVAATIFARAGRELGESAAAAADQVFPAGQAIRVTLTGGLAASGALLLPALLARIERRRPVSPGRVVQQGSLLGALRLAQDPALAGWFPGGLLRARPMTPDVIERLRGQLIVSCQAAGGGPLDEPAIIAALARAAVLGGAGGVRIAGASHIRAVRNALDVPIIGLVKRPTTDSAVYITPTAADGMRVAAAGADIVAIDATSRPRPNGETVVEIIAQLCGRGVLVLADVDSVVAAVAAVDAGAHAVATTLAGYTSGRPSTRPDIALVAAIASTVSCPVVAEGRYRSLAHVRAAFHAGAYAVVVGDAITNPAGNHGSSRRSNAGAQETPRVTRPRPVSGDLAVTRPEPNQVADLVVRGGLVMTVDVGRRVLLDASIAVVNGRIEAIASTADIDRDWTALRVLDATGSVVTPGLIDAHVHLSHQLLRTTIPDWWPEEREHDVWLPYWRNMTRTTPISRRSSHVSRWSAMGPRPSAT